jgi:hypothetical protein
MSALSLRDQPSGSRLARPQRGGPEHFIEEFDSLAMYAEGVGEPKNRTVVDRRRLPLRGCPDERANRGTMMHSPSITWWVAGLSRSPAEPLP